MLKILKWTAIFGIIVSFGITIFRLNSTLPTTSPAQVLTPTPAAGTQQVARDEPIKPDKPPTRPNPKYDKVLSAAIPPEEQKIRSEWDAYEQRECSDATLAANKKILKRIQTERLDAMQKIFKTAIKHNDGDAAAVVRAKQYIQVWANTPEDKSKLTYMTWCLRQRGNVPSAAVDLNPVQSLLGMTMVALVDAYDDKYSSDSLAKFDNLVKNYNYRVLDVKAALADIK